MAERITFETGTVFTSKSTWQLNTDWENKEIIPPPPLAPIVFMCVRLFVTLYASPVQVG